MLMHYRSDSKCYRRDSRVIYIYHLNLSISDLSPTHGRRNPIALPPFANQCQESIGERLSASEVGTTGRTLLPEKEVWLLAKRYRVMTFYNLNLCMGVHFIGNLLMWM